MHRRLRHEVGVERLQVVVVGLGEGGVGEGRVQAWPSRETPSRIARWKALKDQRPRPVSGSGVRLVV
jgi:hypothetical protein